MKLALVYAVNNQRRELSLSILPMLSVVLLLIALLVAFLIFGLVQYRQLAHTNQQLLLQLQAPKPHSAAPPMTQLGQIALQQQLGGALEELMQQHRQLQLLSQEVGIKLPESHFDRVISMEPDFSKTISQQLEMLKNQFNLAQNQYAMVELAAKRHHLRDISFISGWPAWESGVWLSSPFGKRRDPFTGRYRYHEGVDIAGTEGVKIHSVAAGVVSWAGKRFGFGNMVEIEHGNGMVTRYAHTQKVLVQVGDVVTKGETIALMGSTGRSTGPHVHFEVLHNGQHLNPLQYMERRVKKS